MLAVTCVADLRGTIERGESRSVGGDREVLIASFMTSEQEEKVSLVIDGLSDARKRERDQGPAFKCVTVRLGQC